MGESWTRLAALTGLPGKAPRRLGGQRVATCSREHRVSYIRVSGSLIGRADQRSRARPAVPPGRYRRQLAMRSITTRGRIKDATCRSVKLAGQDTSTTQKPTSRHVLSRTQRLLHSGVNSHSSSCTTLCCLHRKGRDGLNTELPAIGHTTLSILAKHHVGRSHIIRLSGTVRNTTQASVSFIAR